MKRKVLLCVGFLGTAVTAAVLLFVCNRSCGEKVSGVYYRDRKRYELVHTQDNFVLRQYTSQGKLRVEYIFEPGHTVSWDSTDPRGGVRIEWGGVMVDMAEDLPGLCIEDVRHIDRIRVYYDTGEMMGEADIRKDIVRRYYPAGGLLSVSGFTEEDTIRYYGRDGKLKDGIVWEYGGDGKIRKAIRCRRGKREGITLIYSPEGRIIGVERYSNNRQEGKQVYFDRKGAIRKKKVSVNGEDDAGEVFVGRVIMEYTVRKGIKDGEEKSYYENGTIRSRTYYRNGKIAWRRIYGRDGKLIHTRGDEVPRGKRWNENH